MSGSITAGGLISGLDTNALVTQLLSLERKPITRLNSQIGVLKKQQTAVRSVRTQLLSLRNKAQDFRLNQIFNAFNSDSSDKEVITSTISGANPVQGSFALNVTQLASATNANSSAKLGSAINNAAVLNSSGINTAVEAGTFTINGVQFTVDPATQSLDDIITAINGSSAGVTASYNATTDTVSLANTVPANTAVINFSAQGDTSNILSALNLRNATQSTNGFGSTEVTSTVNLGAVDSTDVINTINFSGGAVTAGSFSINGVSITVDPTTDTVQDVLERINGSDANVTASFDSATDRIRLTSNTLGSRTIAFGAVGDTSNFLTVSNLAAATQTAGNDASFTINGGPALTRNTNEVNDAIAGVTLKFLSQGTSTVTVTSDNDKIVEGVEAFIAEFNTTVNSIRDITGVGKDLAGDGGIRSLENYLRSNIFNQIPGLSGDYSSLLDIGISTGDDFSATESPQLKLDKEKFLKALQADRNNVESIFSNNAGTGIADTFFSFLDEATKSTGFLNERAKANGTIDRQIQSLNDSIERQEDRLGQYEERLRRQFLNLETMSANFQNQSAALSGARFGAF
jgi:flagellar hook-associated protein 2